MLYFSRWKVTGILAICLLGILLTLPNVFTKDQLGKLPSWVPAHQVSLGLDLRGGTYLLMEVDVDAVVRERLESAVEGARAELRRARINYSDLTAGRREVTLKLRDPAQMPQALETLRKLAQPVGGGGGLGLGTTRADMDVQGQTDGTVTMVLSEEALREKATNAVQQSIEIVRRRIDQTGVNEPLIQRQGANRILVQLPGIDDPDRVKRLLGTTAKMNFRLLDLEASVEGRPPPGTDLLMADSETARDGQPARYMVKRRIEVAGDALRNASVTTDQSGQPVVSFEFNQAGAARFAQVTRDNVGKPFAIVLDDKVISAPVIREPITGGRGQISGNFTFQTANDLAVLLRAGALPAPLKIIEERTVGPDLGADSIRAGLIAVGVGFVLVVIYMGLTYGMFGWFANIALVLNLFLTLAGMSLLGATLTLPGIAGLLLTIGMSVDANVLINERIRDETKLGKSPLSAMEAGFRKAFSTIIDSNITTLLKMLLLFAFGTGAVKGFAVTISLGIITSMFTAIVVVRLMMATWYKVRRPALLPV